jgi:YHS domain-containing protein
MSSCLINEAIRIFTNRSRYCVSTLIGRKISKGAQSTRKFVMLNRRLFLSAIAVSAVSALSTPAFAKKPSVYTGIVAGVGAGGYDVVSYFTDGAPKKGNAKFVANYNGAKWYFTSAEHMKTFQASPGKYAPAYGGYCAYAVANGVTAKGDPKLWKIVGGKLYLNLNKVAQSRWNEDIPGNIASANQNWPKVLN